MSRDTAAPPTPAAPAAPGHARPASRLSAMLDDVGALRNPLYRRFWLGSLGAVGGTQFVILATGWLVVDGLGGSPLSTSGTSAPQPPYRRSPSTSSVAYSPTAWTGACC